MIRRNHLLKITLKLLWTFMVVCSLQRLSWSFPTTYEDSVLLNHAVRNVSSVDWLQCILTCEEDAGCVSYNYYRTERLCQLNDHGIEECEDARSQLLTAEDVIFQQIKPVSRNHISVSDIKAQEQVCVCNCGSGRQCVTHEDKFVKVKPGKGDFSNDTATSCSEIYNLRGAVPSRAYFIRTTTQPQHRHVYCHMTDIPACGGGGWTLVMKINGSRSTFRFDSPHWTDKQEMDIASSKDLNTKETITATYWSTSFENICLGMRNEGITRWMLLPHRGVSLYEVISPNIEVNTQVPTSTWKSLLEKASLQMDCRRQGFNVQSQTKARIGVVGFASKRCSGDLHSVIGFGTSGNYSGMNGHNTCGNVARTDEGLLSTKAFGFILVQ